MLHTMRSDRQMTQRSRGQPCGEESDFMSDSEHHDSDQWSEVGQTPMSEDEWDVIGQSSIASSIAGDQADEFVHVPDHTLGLSNTTEDSIAAYLNTRASTHQSHAARNLNWTSILPERPALRSMTQDAQSEERANVFDNEAVAVQSEANDDGQSEVPDDEDLEEDNGSIYFPSDDEGTIGFDNDLSNTITLPAAPLMEPLQTWHNDLVDNFGLPADVAERIVVLSDIHQVYSMAIYMALTGLPYEDAIEHLQSILDWDLRQIRDLVDIQLANDFAYAYGGSWFNLMMTLETFEELWYKLGLKEMKDARAIVNDGGRWRRPWLDEANRPNPFAFTGDNEDEDEDEDDDDDDDDQDQDHDESQDHDQDEDEDDVVRARTDDDNATLMNDGDSIWTTNDTVNEATDWDMNDGSADDREGGKTKKVTFLDM